MNTDERFNKRLRLLRSTEFERVFAARVSASDTFIVVYGAANDLGHPRLGLTVSCRVGRAVARNRWKRLLREAFRRTQHKLPSIDLICIPRTASPPPMSQLSESVPMLASKVSRQLHRRASRTAGTAS
jgi:ribonuclease P protein component